METDPVDGQDGGDARRRIVAAAARLIADGGIEAATTRAVATAAAVQAPAIYRLFGDKRGLLDAVAEHSFSDYAAEKARRTPAADPVQDLRDGWAAHIAFGVANPGIFALVSAASRAGTSPAAARGLAVLRERVRRIALVGRLRVTEERAVDLLHAMGTGVVLTLLGRPPGDHRDLSDQALDLVLAAIVDGRAPPTGPGPAATASSLRARADELAMLTPGEKLLLGELLERIARG